MSIDSNFNLINTGDPSWVPLKCVVFCIYEQPPIKKKGRYQGAYKEFACGMGFGNFTANYYIKLSFFGFKLMPLPIIISWE